MNWRALIPLFLPGLLLTPSPPGSAAGPDGGRKRLLARAHDSGFDMNHDTWNAMGLGSDGKVYYVLFSESIDRGGQMFAFDPGTDGMCPT